MRVEAGPPAGNLPAEVSIRVEPPAPVAGEYAEIYVEAKDDRPVARLDVLVDGTVIQSCEGAICAVATWFEPGEHLVEGVAVDVDGQEGRNYLHVAATEPTLEAPTLTVSQSADEVFAGECGNPRTLEIKATVEGMARPARLLLRWQYEGIGEQVVEMKQVDDVTWIGEINPSDYCCTSASLVWTVEVYRADTFGAGQVPLARRDGKAQISYCIG